MAVAGTCSDAPIRGAAVETIVPSRISMNMQAATRKPIRRCRASITKGRAPGQTNKGSAAVRS